MSTELRKILRDLWASRSQFSLAVAALVLGVWGVGAMLVANVILRADLRDNFVATRPAHATLGVANLAPPDLAAIRALPSVQGAELRDFAPLRIEVRAGEWIPLWLFGVADFARMDVAQIRPQAGARLPPPGTLLVERDGLKISALRIGASARVRSGARLLQVPVSGVAFDAAQAPATQDHFIYAYTDRQTWTSLTGKPAGRRLIVRWSDVVTQADAKRRAGELARVLVQRGVVVTGIDVPKFEAHPHQWQLDTLLLVQASIGLLAFALGAVLVAQLMAAVMARQARQIAIMKAIGATAPRLFMSYGAMVGIIAALAAAMALPLAVRSGVAFSRFVGEQLNFDIHPGARPWWLDPVLWVVAVSLPLAAAGPRIAHALRRPVRDALDDHGIPGNPGALPAGRALPTGLRLAIRNPWRQRRRALLNVMVLALGVAIFASGFNVRESLALLLRDTAQSMSHDVQVVLDQSLPPARVRAPFDGLTGVARTELWNGGRGELQSRVFATADGIGVVALPADTALVHPRLSQGRWLRAGQGTPEVVMNQQAADLFGHARPGREVTLELAAGRLQAKLVGVLLDLDKPKVYVDRDAWDARFNPQHDANSIMFVAQDKSYPSVMRLKRAIEERLARSDLPVLYVMSQAERVQIVADHLDIVLTVLVLLSVLVLLVGGFGMASSIAIDVQERTRELGVMRAIGATPRQVRSVLVLEGLLVGVVSLALGLLLAQPLSAQAAAAFGQLMLGEEARLRLAVSPLGLAIAAITTVVFAWVASYLPAFRASRTATRVALTHA